MITPSTTMSTEELHQKILIELATVKETLRNLVDRVGVQNGRVGKAEEAIHVLIQKDSTIESDVKEIKARNRVVDENNKRRSSRNVELFYNILEKIIWIGVGVLLYNAERITDFL